MTDHPTQIGQTPPSDAEVEAWRRTDRAALIRDWLKTIGIYLTLGFVVYNTLQVDDALSGITANTAATRETSQEIRDTQTEGSPFILRLTAISEDTQATLEQFRDCVRHGGACAKRNRQQAAQYLQVFGFIVTCGIRYADLPEAAAQDATDDCVARKTSALP